MNLQMRLKSKKGKGQSLVEMALALPMLLIIFLGLIELGLVLRAYLVIVNANREAARFAGRGVYSDDQIAERVAIAVAGQLPATTVGTDPTMGVVISHFGISQNPDDAPIIDPQYVTGTLQTEDPQQSERIRDQVLLDPNEFALALKSNTDEINDELEAQDTAVRTAHNVVVVEVVYFHKEMLNAPLVTWIFPDTMVLYTRAVMREGASRVQ